MRVTVELWLWLGNELKGEFESPSDMRSLRVEVVNEGTRIGDLLCAFASRYGAIGQKVFDLKEKRLHADLVMTYNDELFNPHTALEQRLKDGDKLTIFPLYSGG